MIRYVLLAAVGCGLAGAVAAQPPNDRAVLDKVFADWKVRQGKMKTARYVLAGTVEYIKPLSPDSPAAPPDKRTAAFRATLILDLARGRYRFDKLEDRLGEDGRFISGSGSVAHDGVDTRQGRTPGLPRTGQGFDLLIGKNTKARGGSHPVLDAYWPIFFAHGIIPTVHNLPYLENMPLVPDPEDFVLGGRHALGGRTYQIIKTEPQMAASSLRDEYWVDPGRQSCVRRHVYVAGNEPWTTMDIDWRQTSAGWWPEKWALTLTLDGKVTNRLTKLSVMSYEYDTPVADADFTLPVEPGMEQVIVSDGVPPGRGLDPNRPARRTYRITESGEWIETGATGLTTAGGVQLPPDRGWPGWYVAAGGVVIVAVGMVAWVWRRHRSSARLEQTRTG